jgi:hypothetical protein
MVQDGVDVVEDVPLGDRGVSMALVALLEVVSFASVEVAARYFRAAWTAEAAVPT